MFDFSEIISNLSSQSRISIIIGYEDTDINSRIKVWSNFLNAASIQMMRMKFKHYQIIM